MATEAQIIANMANSLRSTGPTSSTGRQISSQNRAKHGLCRHQDDVFYFIEGESEDKYFELHNRLRTEHAPQTETEAILVRRMAEADWLRTRALRLQSGCLKDFVPLEQFSLYMRYQGTHERAFYKALNELQKLRAERKNSEIGFEALKLKTSAENRALATLKMKQQEFEWKKERHSSAQPAPKTQAAPEITPEEPDSAPQ